MDSHSPPSKMARLADSGNGVASCWRAKESNGCNGAFDSHPIGLKLELGLGGSSGRRVIGSAESYGFTILQLQELNLQSLIYKYIEAGFPVPHHLVVPIWKSVANSLGSIKCLYQLYPSFMTANQSFYMEWKNGGEPEPGRCRRTDGKKWRCSKEAVPDEKYCERHMHRGRQRSRKPVDSSGSACSTNLTIAVPVNN